MGSYDWVNKATANISTKLASYAANNVLFGGAWNTVTPTKAD